MNIEIGKTYHVEPKIKKSVVEIETFSRVVEDKTQYCTIETGWRYGEWNITITNEDEARSLQHALDTDEYLDLDDFEETEMLSTWDGCWEDVELTNVDDDELEEEIREGYYDERWSYLEENGWDQVCYEAFIHNGITVEEVDGDQV